MLVASSCVFTGSTPQFGRGTTGVIVGASCMCATCFTSKFCMNPSTGATKVATADSPCPDADFTTNAVTATQIDSLTARSVRFFCVADSPGLVLDSTPTGQFCPGTPSAPGGGGGSGAGGGATDIPARMALEHVGCNDTMNPGCLPASEQIMCGFPPSPMCSFNVGPAGLAERTACGATMGTLSDSTFFTSGDEAGATEVVNECNLYDIGIPTDMPRRYCYASCIDNHWFDDLNCPLDQPCSENCNPATFSG